MLPWFGEVKFESCRDSEVMAFPSLNTNLPSGHSTSFVSILSANAHLTESIKWNGPNYSLNKEDRITMEIQPPTKVQLIFHRGAKKMEQPLTKLIATKSKFLIWKENDRAIATFKHMQEIKDAQMDLAKIVNEWIHAASLSAHNFSENNP